jgi:hypothetical protein
VRAFVGVLIAAVALGGALAMHNEVRETTTTPEIRAMCSTNILTMHACRSGIYPIVHVGGRKYFISTPAISSEDRPGWVDPVAITLAVAGVGFGLILVAQAATRHRA